MTLHRRIARAVIAWQQSPAGWNMVLPEYEVALAKVVAKVIKEHGKR